MGGPATMLEQIAAPLRAYVLNALKAFAPDLIVSVHPLVQHLSLAALRSNRLSVPFVTVVTDLISAHRAWFHPDVARCYVATERVYRRGRMLGLNDRQLRLTGLPIRPAFVDPMPAQRELRRRLGIAPDLSTVLIIAGRDGVGHIESIAKQVAQEVAKPFQSGQLVIVCGRNQALRRRLANLQWPAPVTILGFVENMAEWMHACDCVVTKAGPGIIVEALACGRPLLLIGSIPGQEKGNIEFVVENGAGLYCAEPSAIARHVACWLSHRCGELEQFSDRAATLARPQATSVIVDDMLELLVSHSATGYSAAWASPVSDK